MATHHNRPGNSTQQPISSASASSEDIDLEDEEEEEEEDGMDSLSAPDFPAQFLQSANWKPINIYQNIDEQQLRSHLRKHPQEQFTQQHYHQLTPSSSQQQLDQQQQQERHQQQLHHHLHQHHHQLQQQQQQLIQQQQQQQQLEQQQQQQHQQQHHQQQQLEKQQLEQQQHKPLENQSYQQLLHPPSQPNPTDSLSASHHPSPRETHRSVTPLHTPNYNQGQIPPPSNDQKLPLDSKTSHPSDLHHQTAHHTPTTLKPSTKISSELHVPTSTHPTHLELPNNNNNNNTNNNRPNRYSTPHRNPPPNQSPSGTLTTIGAEATWGTVARPNSRASIQPIPTTRSKPPASIPTTNRSRMGSSDDNNTPSAIQRPRRVSDGSINGGVRKDLLLQRMAEALQSERAKALVFQKELQNAEREIDELANTLDEQRRVHHKTIVSLKKDIKLLKKERENLVEALEAAEGVEQEEAERYLALLDPAAQAVMVEDEENDDPNDRQRQHKHQIPPHQPILDDYNIADYKSTIRAQMQERSVLRAQRINSELLKINPGSSSDPNVMDSEKDVSEPHVRGGAQQREGRTREPTHRIRRKLSKSRPSSREGSGGGVGVGLFWRRSGSRNRETNEEKTSPALGTVYRNQTDRRKVSAGNQPSIIHHNDNDGGYYDSGPLQRSHESFGKSNNGKIGKLFRKVFPVYKDDRDHQHPEGEDDVNYPPETTHGYDQSPQNNRSKKQIHSEYSHDRNLAANRRRRSVLE